MPVFSGFGAQNGSETADVIIGTGGTSATLTGNGGDDVILGDIATFISFSPDLLNDSITTAWNVETGFPWTVDENPMFADSTIPHTTGVVEVTVGQSEFFAVTLVAGQTLTVDIDGAGATVSDLFVEIQDAGGIVLASNDDAFAQGGLGSITTFDPYLEFTAPADGTYYINIRPLGSSTFSFAQTFMLNLSITGLAGPYHVYTFGDDVIAGGEGNDQLMGVGGNDQITGDNGNDILDGGSGNDTLGGGSGEDVLEGGTGDDTIDGGDGIDTASYASAASAVTVNLGVVAAQNTTGAGTDTLTAIEHLTGTSFNDTLTGNGGVNTLNGGAGTDVLDGAAEDDSLIGGEGSDWLVGGAGNDSLNGGNGNDTVSYAGNAAGVTVSLLVAGVQNTIGAGSDTLINIEHLTGTSHNDTLTGNEGANTLNGSAGTDVLFGEGGNDNLVGGEGSDWLVGGAGNDTLNGGNGNDTASYAGNAAGVTVNLLIAGAQNTVGAGSDTLIAIEHLTGTSFNDRLTGNANHNTLSGGAGTDIMAGNSGNDTLIGAEGSDGLSGNNGNDTLNGGNGSDTIVGGAGNDALTGGAGNDIFRFDASLSTVSNVDTIGDFDVPSDTVQLDRSFFAAVGSVGTLSAGAFHIGGSAADASDRIIYNNVTGRLYYDADGSGAGAQVLFAQLSAGLALTNADFSIIA